MNTIISSSSVSNGICSDQNSIFGFNLLYFSAILSNPTEYIDYTNLLQLHRIGTGKTCSRLMIMEKLLNNKIK